MCTDTRAVSYQPLCVLHVVCIAWSLLVDVTTRPLRNLPQRIHHSRVGSGMGSLEVLVPIGRGNNTSTLGRMLLYSHVRTVCCVALRYVLSGDKSNTFSQWK